LITGVGDVTTVGSLSARGFGAVAAGTAVASAAGDSTTVGGCPARCVGVTVGRRSAAGVFKTRGEAVARCAGNGVGTSGSAVGDGKGVGDDGSWTQPASDTSANRNAPITVRRMTGFTDFASI
jgi:hypothetical protein